MKKFMFAMVAMMAMTFVSCHCGATSQAEATDSVAVDTVVVDTVAVDSAVVSE